MLPFVLCDLCLSAVVANATNKVELLRRDFSVSTFRYNLTWTSHVTATKQLSTTISYKVQLSPVPTLFSTRILIHAYIHPSRRATMLATTQDQSGFSALDETDWKRTANEDDEAIMSLLSGSQQGTEGGGLPADLLNIKFSQEGKAADAEDFEDISDDDLPDEEEPTAPTADAPGLTDDAGTSHETDDLFGDHPSPSGDGDGGFRMSPEPLEGDGATNGKGANGDMDDMDDGNSDVAAARSPSPGLNDPYIVTDSDRALNFPEDYGHDTNQDPNIPPVAENLVDLVKMAFPTFEKGKILNFNEQLAPKPLYLTEKKPAKPPKPLVPTKLSLEFEADQEKLFRFTGTAQATIQQKIAGAASRGFVSLLKLESTGKDNGNIFMDTFGDEDDDDDAPIGGFHLKDFAVACVDWQEVTDPPTPPREDVTARALVKAKKFKREVDDDDEWDREILGTSQPKRRKIITDPGLPALPRYNAPSFDAFEEATSRAAKRVYLDMSDHRLLLDDGENDRDPKRAKMSAQKRLPNGRLVRDLTSRFNYSNDQAYDMLKENHQHRVRAQHTNVQVEHSLPALRLLWPYYAITRYGPEPHDYHRPQLKVNKGIGFPVRMAKLHKVAKREWKFKKIQEIFSESKDLSLGDNSTAVLFEYCEEVPTVLSNFGMGNKIINYYRRKTKGDEEKPAKPDLGELSFLLPEDKSPFSNFGTVDPGEVVPTLHNPMFHAPIFKHQARPTDFLFGRTHTSETGTLYYLRKIDQLFTVGQTFPLAEVPGPHSRKVTALSKNRLKMVAYRMIAKNGSVSLSDITAHVKDSNDAQNRQKLKEFLHYDKETKTWGLKPNDALMDLATINSMIKPDEVCLHDAMQVGQNELAQNGYQLDDNAALDDVDDENDKESLAQNMVPWKTTKSFIDACAGKAMLQLHGAGDPTGRGLGFSFIRTSMKGGFMGAIHGPAATSADAMERERKANNGHMYNVKKQDALYNDAIRKIWASQRSTLQDDMAHDDEDVQPQDDEDDRFNAAKEAATPAPAHLDDSVSQLSKPSMSQAPEKRKLRITRTYTDPKTGQTVSKTEIVHDPGVISQYMRQRASLDMEKIDPYSVKPTGNLDYDRVLMQRLETEEARLNRNKERRHAREKQKALQQQINHDGDPDSPAPSIERGGTTRKCANCGLQGHIKTNKKLCPMLNGMWKNDKNAEEGGFGVYNNGQDDGLAGPA
ncbi:taf1-like protein [Ophiostoma piceae UAMH 11346]|uniref:Taf1-like protein n=1 Tax=Ophiostoma piceae (strain UAMH 11346) TaxID=1262450 RepID=S3C0K7_OPHP1|nr:taf1-like protein [Ophiostoma piceae UAMH 11346]